jgi:hypothetical protein
MQDLYGVDLTEFFREVDSKSGQRQLLCEKWVRCPMGLKSLPYQVVQAIIVAKQVILGERLDAKNVFGWDEVQMNLPGSAEYNPSLLWVSKIRVDDGNIAANLFIYVDDVRITGNSAKECDAAAQRAVSVANDLWVQDAPRKQRFGEQEAGAWAGSVVGTDGQGVFVTVS